MDSINVFLHKLGCTNLPPVNSTRQTSHYTSLPYMLYIYTYNIGSVACTYAIWLQIMSFYFQIPHNYKPGSYMHLLRIKHI